MSAQRGVRTWKTRSGRDITEADAQRMAVEFESTDVDFADAVHPRRRGRPSLTGRQQRSPQVTFRVDDDTLQRATDVADRDGMSLSALARRALDDYLMAHG